MYNESEFSEAKNVQVPIIASQNEMFNIFKHLISDGFKYIFFIDRLLY